MPTVGQVTTSTGKKKREASHLVETHPKNTLVVTLDGNPIDFNEIIAPSRVNKIIFKEGRTKKNCTIEISIIQLRSNHLYTF